MTDQEKQNIEVLKLRFKCDIAFHLQELEKARNKKDLFDIIKHEEFLKYINKIQTKYLKDL